MTQRSATDRLERALADIAAGSAEGGVPGFRLGTRVRHQKFGDGMILNIEGQGAQARIQVNFEQHGSKWLMLSYANLETIR